MTLSYTTIRLTLALTLGVSLACAADRPHEAAVVTTTGDSRTIYVFAETLGGLEFAQTADSPSAQGTMQWDRIASLSYEEIRDPDYNRALGAYNQQDFAKAASLLEKVASGGRTQHTRVAAVELQVESYGADGQADQAASTIDAFANANPEHPKVVDLLYRKGSIFLAAKQYQAASTAFQDLADRSARFRSKAGEAMAMGTAGVAEVQLAQGDAAAAVTSVNEALSGVSRDAQPSAYAQIAVVGVRALQEQGQADAALAMAQDIQFLGDALAPQVEAQLRLAQLLESSDPIAAFDHAAIAATRGQGTVLGREAGKLARKIASAISTDEARPDAQRQEYKDYIRSL